MKTAWKKSCSRYITLDAASTMVGGRSVGDDVRSTIDLFKTPSDPNNMGKHLGGDDMGIGTDCAHLEGPESDHRTHKKIGSSLDTLFPMGFVPPPNALEIATAPTVEELEALDENEALKDSIRERYRLSRDLKQAEKDRIERANKHLKNAVNGIPSITQTVKAEENKAEPDRLQANRIYQQFERSDPYDAMEEMGNKVSKLLKKTKEEKTVVKGEATTPVPKKTEQKVATGSDRSLHIKAARMLVQSLAQEDDQKMTEMMELWGKRSTTVSVPTPDSTPDGEKKKITLREKMQQKQQQKQGAAFTEEDKLRMRVLELESKNVALRMERERERLYALLRGE